MEEVIQHTGVHPLRDKDRQRKEQLVIHRPETGHNHQKEDELNVFQYISHIGKDDAEGFQQRVCILFRVFPSRLLVEEQQNEVERDNPGRDIKDKVGRSFEQQGDHRPEESPDIDHHIENTEPDRSRLVRCRL